MFKVKINKLTIVIPTFNSALYIAKTLKFLENQSDKDFEVLIVDDNSEDETKEIVKLFKDRMKIRFVRKPKKIKKGAAASINFALKIIKSNWVALIDSDTFLYSNWVFVVKNLLRRKKIVGAPVLADRKGGILAYTIGLEIESRYYFLSSGYLRHLSTCNLAFEKNLLEKIKLNENLLYAYDHDLSFKLRNKGKLFYLTKKTACQHINKRGVIDFFIQQYRIAKYHTMLAKLMPKEAISGDEISPSFLIFQPLMIFLFFIILFYSPLLSMLPLLLAFLFNIRFLIFLIIKKKSQYIIFALILIFIRNIAWIFGGLVGLIKVNYGNSISYH